jgi:hypothetical protein
VCSLASLGVAAPAALELAPRAVSALAARLGRATAPLLDASDVPDEELFQWLTVGRAASRVA